MIKLPYGKEFLEIDEKILNATVLMSKEVNRIENIKLELINKIENPIKSKPLSKIISKAKKMLLLVPDKTRAFPSKMILPIFLESIGRNDIEIKILIATGLHKPHTINELREILGDKILNEYEVKCHDAEDYNQIIRLNKKTRFGTPIEVNNEIFNNELVIGFGLIEPHFFAGYSGGRKIILPGIASSKAIYCNHSFKMIEHPYARYGYLNGNPIHEDMIEFMNKTKLDFIVNVTIDKNKNITGIFCGNPIEAHIRGVEFLNSYVKVPVNKTFDIVITTNGGYPLDRNLYQAVKGMATGELIVNRNGVIIIASECIDGLGGHDEFYNMFLETKNPIKVLEKIKREEPIKDQWEAQVLARILMKARIIVVSKMKQSIIEDMLMIPASTIDEAINEAIKIINKDKPKVAIAPEGPYIIPEIKD